MNKYEIKRCFMSNVMTVTIDLWDDTCNTGYEIHVTICRHAHLLKFLELFRVFVGTELTIVQIDNLIRALKGVFYSD